MALVYLHNIWMVLLELAPWLLLGCLVAGVLHVVVPPSLLRRHLGKPGLMSTMKAALIGVPMPLCSCGVIPTAIGLRRDGASEGASVGFLISTPQTGVDSIAVAISFLGWPFALFKVFSAFVTGLVGGVLVDVGQHEAEAPTPTADGTQQTPRRTWRDIFGYGFGEILGMIWYWVLFGVVVSAAITTWVPAGALQQTALTSGFAAMFLMLAISLPLYVCATASVPIAAALVQAGMPTGAALVFLMAGPASNIATVGAIYRAFGRRTVLIYLGTVAVGSMVLGWAFDFVIGGAGSEVVTMAEHHGPVATGAAIVLLALMAWFAWRALRHRLARPPTASQSLTLGVAGMTCEGCANTVRGALLKIAGVEAVEVDLEARQVVVYGHDLEAESLRDKIRAAGYTPA